MAKPNKSYKKHRLYKKHRSFKKPGSFKKHRSYKKPGSFKKHRSYKRARAPETPISNKGTLNPVWVKHIEHPITHITYVLGPDGSYFPHVTFNIPGDNIKYHYGFEANANLHKNRHHWTTPYNQEFPEVLKKYLVHLYNTNSDQ